jgi:hypothetical protein
MTSTQEQPEVAREVKPVVGKKILVTTYKDRLFGSRKVFRHPDNHESGAYVEIPYGTVLRFKKGIAVKASDPNSFARNWGVKWPKGVTVQIVLDEGDVAYLHPNTGERGISLRHVPDGTSAVIVSLPKSW